MLELTPVRLTSLVLHGITCFITAKSPRPGTGSSRPGSAAIAPRGASPVRQLSAGSSAARGGSPTRNHAHKVGTQSELSVTSSTASGSHDENETRARGRSKVASSASIDRLYQGVPVAVSVLCVCVRMCNHLPLDWRYVCVLCSSRTCIAFHTCCV